MTLPARTSLIQAALTLVLLLASALPSGCRGCDREGAIKGAAGKLCYAAPPAGGARYRLVFRQRIEPLDSRLPATDLLIDGTLLLLPAGTGRAVIQFERLSGSVASGGAAAAAVAPAGVTIELAVSERGIEAPAEIRMPDGAESLRPFFDTFRQMVRQLLPRLPCSGGGGSSSWEHAAVDEIDLPAGGRLRTTVTTGFSDTGPLDVSDRQVRRIGLNGRLEARPADAVPPGSPTLTMTGSGRGVCLFDSAAGLVYSTDYEAELAAETSVDTPDGRSVHKQRVVSRVELVRL